MSESDNYQKPVVVRRVFSGKFDPSMNDDPVTSKYMPSHKFAVVYFENGKRMVRTCTTKAEAEKWVGIYLEQDRA